MMMRYELDHNAFFLWRKSSIKNQGEINEVSRIKHYATYLKGD